MPQSTQSNKRCFFIRIFSLLSSCTLWQRSFEFFKTAIFCFALIGLLSVQNLFGAGNFFGKTERLLRYKPVGTDFVIENGQEFFNRPLYGTNTAFRVDAGDKPEFTLYLPGRGGNLRLGIKTATGQKWLNDATEITTRYRPGAMVYEIRDSFLGKGVLNLYLLALSETEGLILRADLQNTSTSVDLVFAYGGVNGERGRRAGDIGTESIPISQYFQLKPEYCRDNVFEISANSFKLKSKPANVLGLSSESTKLEIADANNWGDVQKLLASVNNKNELPVIVGQYKLEPNHKSFIALQYIANQNPYREIKAEELKNLFDKAEAHRRAIAEKIIVDTPDAFINAAASALAVAADGVWDEPQGAFMHGAVAWRSKLLGWRGGYSGDALGWHERARRHFTYWAGRQNTNPIPESITQDASVNFARNEPALHSNGDISNSHYDMNLVYIDALFRHILWTGDVEFARQVFPVIEKHLNWEKRLFRREFGKDKLPLYEAYTAIWASDDLQYHGGGVTHSTAYNYYHNKMAARIAKLIGKDAAPYEREAGLILKAMQRELWLKQNGWFAEWKDSLGLQLAHPNAALWTFYHTIDSESSTPFESWQMSRFVDTQIAHIPIHGADVPKGNYFTLPTTSWMPYTWSTNNVVMAEVSHTSLAYWQAGRNDVAFQLFKGSILDSMFLGLCPGNLGMATYFDMARGESQRDFADAVGTNSRAFIEGLFGVKPNALDGELIIRPGFPSEWNHANLRHTDFGFSFTREGLKETYKIESNFSKPMALRLQVNALRDAIESVSANGKTVKWILIDDSIGLPRIEITSEAASKHEVVIKWKGKRISTANAPAIVAKGNELNVSFLNGKLLKIYDPQNALTNVGEKENSLRADATGEYGHRTVFAKVEQGKLNWWIPFMFEIRPAFQITQKENQDADNLRFFIVNNTGENIKGEATIRTNSDETKTQLSIPAFGKSQEIKISKGLQAGSNLVAVDFANGKSVEGVVTNWKIKSNEDKWETINLLSVFNDEVTRIFKNEYLSPRSPHVSLAIPKQGIGSWVHWDEKFDVDDSGLRAVADKNQGRLVLPQGIPFQTVGTGDSKNVVFTSQWDNYPREISVPLQGKSSHVYLLMAGSTNQMQSQFDNGEVIITYTDGTTEKLALRNPTTWWAIDQDYFIDDYAFRRPEPVPPRVDLKTGNVRVPDITSFKGKGGKIDGGAATVLDLPLNKNKELKTLTVRTLANEVVIGLMAITLTRG